jgi:hypothetical protein
MAPAPRNAAPFNAVQVSNILAVFSL